MASPKRRHQERAATTRMILDAARDLFISEGCEHVSIRKIADRIDYSPAAIYRCFPSKDDIFFALAEEGFRLLHEDGFDHLAQRPPLESVRAIFDRLYRFSDEHPQYFALMFVDHTVPRIAQEYHRFAAALQQEFQLVGHVRRCIDAGLFRQTIDPIVAFRMLTATVVGIAVMQQSERLGPAPAARALAANLLDVTIAGLCKDVDHATDSVSAHRGHTVAPRRPTRMVNRTRSDRS